MTTKNKPVPGTAIAPIEEVRRNLQTMRPQFQMVLPSNVTPDKFIRVAMTSIQNNPDLLNCSRNSLYSAVTKCAQDGLLPDSREAAIVKFNSKQGPQAQYMPMLAGILKKVRNSGELSSITSQVVYEQDEFDFWVDEKGERLKHRPKLIGERGGAVFVYAIAITKDEASYIEVMSKEEIEKVRASSRAKDGGPWTSWWSEMAKKTVIRRLSKKLPMSTDLEQVVRADDELYDLNEAAAPQLEAPKNKSSRLTHLIEASGKDKQPEVVEEKPQQQPENEDIPI